MMARKPAANKRKSAPENKGAEVAMVTVRVLLYRGIGGVGGPGTVAQMPREMAEKYAREGYVEIIEEA